MRQNKGRGTGHQPTHNLTVQPAAAVYLYFVLVQEVQNSTRSSEKHQGSNGYGEYGLLKKECEVETTSTVTSIWPKGVVARQRDHDCT